MTKPKITAPTPPKPTPVIEKTDRINVPPVAGPTSRKNAAELAAGATAGAEATASVAKERKAVVAKYDPAPLGGNEPTDVLGRRWKSTDIDDRKIQAREAIAERDARVQSDVDRVTHGLEPQHATE